MRVFHGDALTCQRLAIELHMHLGCRSIAVQIQVNHAIDVLHQRLGLLKNAAQGGNIGAEQLEHDLAARARCGLFHAVANRLREIEGHAGNLTQRRTHFLDQRGLGQTLAPFAMGLEAHQYLGQIQRLVVGARFGASLLRGDGNHLGEDLEAQTHIAQHFLTFFQRDGSRHLHQHIGIALIEFGQELGAQPFG